MASEQHNGSSAIGYLKIASGGKCYVYDRTTNACVRISDTENLVLDEFLAHGADAVRERYRDHGSPEELGSALKSLDELTTRHGMFQPPPKIDLSGWLASGELEQLLESPRRQLTLNVTEQCNQRCTYCIYSGDYSHERWHTNRAMTWPVARKCIDDLIARSQDHTTSRLDFYGGEPLLKWDLVKRCIVHARASEAGRRLKIVLNSNLTLLDDDRAAFLVNNDVHISMSLDGPGAVHDAARVFAGGRGTFDRVTRRLKRLMELYPEYCRTRLAIKCTYDRTANINELFDYFSHEPYTDLVVEMHPVRALDGGSSELASEDWCARQNQLDQMMAKYAESIRANRPVNHHLFKQVFGTVFSKIATRRLEVDRGGEILERLCLPSMNSLFVNSNGRFFTCENFSHPDNCIGSVEAGIDTKRVRALLETYLGFREEVCRQCWAARLCFQCFVHTLDEGRMSEMQMRENCVRGRRMIAKAFERFLYLWEHEPPEFHDHPSSLHYQVKNARDR